MFESYNMCGPRVGFAIGHVLFHKIDLRQHVISSEPSVSGSKVQTKIAKRYALLALGSAIDEPNLKP